VSRTWQARGCGLVEGVRSLEAEDRRRAEGWEVCDWPRLRKSSSRQDKGVCSILWFVAALSNACRLPHVLAVLTDNPLLGLEPLTLREHDSTAAGRDYQAHMDLWDSGLAKAPLHAPWTRPFSTTLVDLQKIMSC